MSKKILKITVDEPTTQLWTHSDIIECAYSVWLISCDSAIGEKPGGSYLKMYIHPLDYREYIVDLWLGGKGFAVEEVPAHEVKTGLRGFVNQ